MRAPDLQRIAYTVECFLNALRLEDGAERTSIEEWLVRWLANPARRKADCVIYSKSRIDCYCGRKVEKSFAVPAATQPRTIWCDGNKLSVIDGEEFISKGALVMLGASGLMLTMPGVVAADARKKRDSGGNSNNNNNNRSITHNTLTIGFTTSSLFVRIISTI